jgi:hypothetical protein
MVTFKGNITQGTFASGYFPDKSGLIVYPNPAKNIIRVIYQGPGKPKFLRIFDMNGRMVKSSSDGLDGNLFLIDVSSLRSGIYLISVSTGDSYYTQKLVINH